jgi:tetratricopeptide (TPR) repeat protein
MKPLFPEQTMEGRASAFVALGLLAGLAGCTPQGTSSLLPSDAGASAPVAAAPKENGPKRQPKPATCLAAGRLREQEASDPKRTPAERERMLDQARAAYQQALDTDPNFIPAWEALGRLYLTMEQPDRATETLKKGLEKHPQESSLWYALGMCHSRQHQWDPAIEDLRKAQELDPESRPYAHALGFCLARAGRYDESLACFQKIESPAQASYNLARMLHHLKKDDLCRRYVELALQADPQMEPARQLLAQLDGKASGGVPVGFDAPDAPAGASGR